MRLSICGQTSAAEPPQAVFQFLSLILLFTQNHMSPTAPERFNVSTQQLEMEPLWPISPEYTNIWNLKHG